MRWILLFILLAPLGVMSQTTGGKSVFNFLEQSNSTLITALGGINVSSQVADLSPAFHTPSLLTPAHNERIAASFQSLYGGIKNYQLLGAFHSAKLETTFSGGVHFFSYGSVVETDAAGNEYGTIRPSDYVVQTGFARRYLDRWSYGGNLKFIHSSYGAYRSSGLAIDLSVSYRDTGSQWQASLVLKNMGAQLKAYEGTDPGDLPFDIQAGISKRLKYAPLQFSLTAHHLFRYNILYNDPAYSSTNGLSNAKGFDNLFAHLVVAAQLFLTDKIEIDAGYNHLRRKELSAGTTGNGLNGFSMGLGLNFRVIQLRYARSYYFNNRSFNQVGLEFNLKGK